MNPLWAHKLMGKMDASGSLDSFFVSFSKYPYQESPVSALWGLCHTWDLGPATPQFPEMVTI